MADIEERKSGLQAFSSNTRAIIGSLIAAPLAAFYYFRNDTGKALMSLVAGACLVFVVSARWNLRKLRWFWIAIAISAGINVALIVLIPWPSTNGIRGPVLAPVGGFLGGLDYLVVLIAIKIMGLPSEKNVSDEKTVEN